MKEFYRLKLTLLTPLFYWSKISPGAVLTDVFIGDLALYYAINKVANLVDVSSSFYGKFVPNYQEIKKFDFWVSCARPIKYDRTEYYSHKTEFKAEVGNSTPKLEELASKSPYKGWFRQQGIAPLSQFEAIIYAPKDIIPPTIRVGTHLHTLVKIDCVPLKEEDNILLNLYSWQNIFNQNIDISLGRLEYKLPVYITLDLPLSDKIKNEIAKIKD